MPLVFNLKKNGKVQNSKKHQVNVINHIEGFKTQEKNNPETGKSAPFQAFSIHELKIGKIRRLRIKIVVKNDGKGQNQRQK